MGKPKFVIHTPKDILGIREAATRAAQCLDRICRAVRPGMSTQELDRFAGQVISEMGCTSAFLNYHGFPANICISMNDEVVHGIGHHRRVIKMGDIVSIDCGVHYKGFVGDNARTVAVGPPSRQAQRLMEVTKASLMAGIDAAQGGNSVRDIGRAVERTVTAAGYAVVEEFVGHGVGKELHEPPEVPNYPTRKGNVKLHPGMVLAIEPMVNVGTAKVTIADDGWTVNTEDGALSAHFEHMVLITNNKPEILTWLKTQ
jgi:methionyl aminopeptidase